jgi:ribosomal protein L7/L12
MRHRVVLAAALWVCGASLAQAADPQARAFVQQLVEAINRGDAASRRALMHPAALRCDGLDAAAAWAPRREAIPPGYRWRIEALPAGLKGLFAERFDYAVAPTHHLHIDYDSATHRSQSVLLQLVRERGGAWREVTGCPTLKTMDEARAAAPQRAEQATRIERVSAQLAPALKAEVTKLVAEGRKVDAILRVREATGEDLAVAKGVVDRLVGADR